MTTRYHDATEGIQTKVRRPRGWPAPTHFRTWSEAETIEMMSVFGHTSAERAALLSDRHWDRLAREAEELARIDMGLVC